MGGGASGTIAGVGKNRINRISFAAPVQFLIVPIRLAWRSYGFANGGPLEGTRANQGVQLATCMRAKDITVVDTWGPHFQVSSGVALVPGPSCRATSVA